MVLLLTRKLTSTFSVITEPQGRPFPTAVIFDMDGTLVATTEADFLAWQRIFNDAGKPLSFDDYFPLLGKKARTLYIKF